MAQHFSKAFREAYEKVLLIAKAEGEHRGKLAFRDAMLELGHEERIRNLYRIQDKLSKSATFFVPNASQNDYLKTKSARNIILKCRQVGFTTLNCIRALDYALWEPNSRSGILCHKLYTVKSIFNDITKFCYNWFLKDWGHLYRPVQEKDSANSLAFSSDGLGRPLESSIQVMNDFRGKTLYFLHVSEASRVDPLCLVGSLNGVPENGEATLESTANGRGGEFYRLWDLHRKAGPTAPYKGYFVPWFVHYPENMEKWNFPTQANWTPKELELLKEYPEIITPNHLLWRRWCIDTNCAGDPEKFENEYPTNDNDCFFTGEAQVFPSEVLKMHYKATKEPLFVGHLILDGKKVETLSDPKGPIVYWEKPVPGHTYVIGADPSGGVGKDRGAAYVKDQSNGKLVARLWGDLVPDDFAREIYKLASFYNKAWACIEANNHGHVVLHVLAEMGYRNLYKRAAVDEVTHKPTSKIGFLTNNQNKIMITEKLKSAARDRKVIIYDKDLIDEMTTFVQVASKQGSTIRREASSGSHDDLVIAAALTEEIHSTRNFESFPESAGRHDVNSENVMVDPETGFIIGVAS